MTFVAYPTIDFSAIMPLSFFRSRIFLLLLRHCAATSWSLDSRQVASAVTVTVVERIGGRMFLKNKF